MVVSLHGIVALIVVFRPTLPKTYCAQFNFDRLRREESCKGVSCIVVFFLELRDGEHWVAKAGTPPQQDAT